MYVQEMAASKGNLVFKREGKRASIKQDKFLRMRSDDSSSRTRQNKL